VASSNANVASTAVFSARSPTNVLTGREYSGGTLKLKSVLDLLPVAVLVPATLRANVEAADNAIRH
jgi:hypothetical protein